MEVASRPLWPGIRPCVGSRGARGRSTGRRPATREQILAKITGTARSRVRRADRRAPTAPSTRSAKARRQRRQARPESSSSWARSTPPPSSSRPASAERSALRRRSKDPPAASACWSRSATRWSGRRSPRTRTASRRHRRGRRHASRKSPRTSSSSRPPRRSRPAQPSSRVAATGSRRRRRRPAPGHLRQRRPVHLRPVQRPQRVYRQARRDLDQRLHPRQPPQRQGRGQAAPQWFSSGPVASALEWGIQAWGMLDMGNDIRVLRDFFAGKPALPPCTNAVAEPRRAGPAPGDGAGARPARHGAARRHASKAATCSWSRARRTRRCSTPSSVRRSSSQNYRPARSGSPPRTRSRARAWRYGRHRLRGPQGPRRAQGPVQPAMIGATALGLVVSAIGVKNTLATKGARRALNTQQGRGQRSALPTNTAFLGMYLLPMVLMALGCRHPGDRRRVERRQHRAEHLRRRAAAQQLRAVRWRAGQERVPRQRRVPRGVPHPAADAARCVRLLDEVQEEAAAAEAAKLEAAQKLAVERITQQREMAKLQLQSTGQVSGAVQGPDGTMQVPTTVPQRPVAARGAARRHSASGGSARAGACGRGRGARAAAARTRRSPNSGGS